MSSAVNDLLTFCIPTRNRPEFLQRLLSFFQQTDVRHPILIVDSSEASKAAQNRSVINSASSALNIKYAYADLPIVGKCCEGLSRVQTPYVAFCADDDFQFPDVVAGCIKFLEHNEDYAAAQGRVIHVSNSQSGRGTVFTCKLLKAYDVEHCDAAKRFATMAANPYSTFYAVYRTPLLKHSFETTERHTDYQAARVFMESMLIGLSAIAGKIKVLPAVQYIQETHGENDSCVLPRIADRSRRNDLYQRYKQGLVGELAALAGMSRLLAEQLVDEHVSLVPGMRGGGRSGTTAWYQKVSREIRRLGVKAARMTNALLPREQSSRQGATIRIDSADSFPDGMAYQIARDLLEQHPMGISTDALVNQSRQSA